MRKPVKDKKNHDPGLIVERWAKRERPDMPTELGPAHVGARLLWARLMRGVSQRGLGDVAAEATIKRIESGEQSPTVDRAWAFAKALNVNPIWLMVGEGPVEVEATMTAKESGR